MSTMVKILHSYVAPFLTGTCMAAAASGVEAAPVFFVAAAGFGLLSFPAGRRLIARVTGAAA